MNINGQASGLNRFLGIVIAVAIIGLIVFFSVKLYNLRTSNLESENARKLLDNIIGKIDTLKDGESGDFAFRGVGNKWYLVGWDKEEKNKPDKCFFDSCLCVCESESLSKISEGCQNNGFCRTLNFDNVSSFQYNYNGHGEMNFVVEMIDKWKTEGIDLTAKIKSNDGKFGTLVQCPEIYETDLINIIIYKTDKQVVLLKNFDRKPNGGVARYRGECK